MTTYVPMECNKRIYKVGGNFPNMTRGTESIIGTNNINEKNSVRKVRRAFSITRNPFRWSRKYYKPTNNDEYLNKKDEILKIKKNDEVNQNQNQLQQQQQQHQISPSEREGTDAHHHQNQKHGNNCNVNNNNKSSTTTANKVLRRSSFRKFLSRIAQHVTSVSIGANKNSSTSSTNVLDRVPPIGGYQWPPDQTPGVTGLKNHGNTCFMNAVLQCLSHTDILAEYFVLDQYKADLKRRNKLNSRKFGTKGELTEQLANVLKALWTCKNESDHSTSFKAVVDRYGSQFQSSTQHDAQEFLFWLLDKVHEDLNTATKRRYKTVKNNYGRPDEVIAAETLANHIRCNNSFVQAVFQAQFRSSLTCPRCHKQSNTFDPFHCISVQLPQLSQQTIFVTVLYVTQHPRQVKLGLTVPPGSPIVVLREQLHADTGIPANRMVLADINENGFSRVFYDSQPISTLNGIDSIYCIEIPAVKDESSSSSELMLLIANVRKLENGTLCRFGTPFCVQVNRDCSYVELQKKLLKEMSAILKSEVFAYTTPLTDMFEIRLQDPSADPDTYLEQVEHPLFTEIIDMALSVLSSEAGPPHIKLLLEWNNPEEFFLDLNDHIVEHESVSLLKDSTSKNAPLTLEQCLEHYTKAETLSAEDAWRCPNCQQYLPVVKTLGLWSLPDILVIHFKRFRQQNDKGPDAAKLTTMVKFPLNSFDMSPHLARGSVLPSDSLNEDSNGGIVNSGNNNIVSRHLGSSPWRKPRDINKYRDKEPKDNRYDLYAVCYHQGETLETGHYTAACKNPYDHQWYKFDDQRVTHVPADEVQDQIVNNEAYILFYQRRKFDNSECSGTSSTSGDHWVSRITVPPTPSISAASTTSHYVNKPLSSTGTTTINTLNLSENNSDNIVVDEMKNVENKKTIDIKFDNTSNQKGEFREEKYIATEATFIEKTDENELVDVEALENVTVDDKEYDTINISNTAKNIHSIDEKIMKPVTSASNRLKLMNHQGNNDNELSIASNYILQQQDKIQITGNSYLSNALSSTSTSTQNYGNIKDDKVQQKRKNDNRNKDIWPKTLLNENVNTNNENIMKTFLTNEQRNNEDNDASKIDIINNHSFNKDNLTFLTTNRKNEENENDSLITTGVNQSNNIKLCHSFSSNSSYKLKETCDTLSMLRNTSNSCSKDTLLYIDQQNHHTLMEDDDSFLGSRSIWISPVTPHKLITVSPKN